MDMVQSARGAVRWYLIFLVALCVPIYLLAAQTSNQTSAEGFLVLLMFVPLLSALFSRIVTGTTVGWGKFQWRSVLGGVMFPGAVILAYYGASWLGRLTFVETPAIPALFFSIAVASVLAFGEEAGWRGYLLPAVRKRYGLVVSNLFVAGVWFLFHVPAILLGLYGNELLSLPMELLFFALNISALSFIMGILWEYSRDVWTASVAHGSWNAIVQLSLPASFMAGSPWLMGEFGLIPFGALSVVLVAATVIYQKWPPREGESSSEAR